MSQRFSAKCVVFEFGVIIYFLELVKLWELHFLILQKIWRLCNLVSFAVISSDDIVDDYQDMNVLYFDAKFSQFFKHEGPTA